MKMKKNKILTGIWACSLSLSALFMTGCDDFLDTMPDNRTEIDTEEKVVSLLTSAYPGSTYAFISEVMSDNVDSYGAENPYTERALDQMFHWEDVTEATQFNDGTEGLWNDSYAAIANANLALQAIRELEAEDKSSATLNECKAEALLCRAYNHFILVNMFCQHYNRQTSSTDLGIPYATEPETTLKPTYERGTVAEVYEKIETDLKEALPLVGDGHLTIPKYHFNKQAAYAFAARFYLYYERWDEVIKYASLCLGSSPATVLRDWSVMASLPQGDEGWPDLELHYVGGTLNCNLLLVTAYSGIGYMYNAYTYGAKYSHGNYLAEHEDGMANNVWGTSYYEPMAVYAGTNVDKTVFWRLPNLLEWADASHSSYYVRTVVTALTTDECLLNRAEAYIMKRQYSQAVADMNTWTRNIMRSPESLSLSKIRTAYNSVGYCYDDSNGMESTIKKHLHPAFDIDAEGSDQEVMLQCLLGIRRVETLHTGLRWFDVKRYGIEIPRREMNASGQPVRVTDKLTVNDTRRAIQLPMKVRQAGLEANPR